MTSLLVISALSLLAAWAFAYAQNRDHAQYVGRLHDEHNRERDQWARERQLLLNRIKPETAQYVAPDKPIVPTPPIGMDDDEGHWDRFGGMSTADLADAVMEAELAGRPE
jgi:hypothetical protein